MQELGREWVGGREGLAGRGQEEERAQSDIAALLTRNNGESMKQKAIHNIIITMQKAD